MPSEINQQQVVRLIGCLSEPSPDQPDVSFVFQHIALTLWNDAIGWFGKSRFQVSDASSNRWEIRQLFVFIITGADQHYPGTLWVWEPHAYSSGSPILNA